MSIKLLQKLAELNLCEKCFQKYKALLEPSIKAWRSKPLGAWNQVELFITAMVMKLEGVFKDEKTIIFSIDKEGKNAKEVDVKAFRKIERWSMKEKIAYLKKKNIFQDDSYKVLDIARKRRNKIHDVFSGISEEDYKLFDAVVSVVENLFFATVFYPDRNDVHSMMIANSERVAKHILEKLMEK